MRKVVYSLTNSLDNFIARADGGYDWIFGIVSLNYRVKN